MRLPRLRPGAGAAPSPAAAACALALLALLLGTGEAAAQSCRETLAGLRPNEVQAELRTGRSIEIPVRDVYAAIGPVATRGDPSDLVMPGFRPLRREIPVLWRARLPRRADLTRMRVEYSVRPGSGPDGFAEALDPAAGAAASIPISVLPGVPSEVCSYRSWTLVEGGALIEFELGALPAAGTYRASIRVKLRDW